MRSPHSCVLCAFELCTRHYLFLLSIFSLQCFRARFLAISLLLGWFRSIPTCHVNFCKVWCLLSVRVFESILMQLIAFVNCFKRPGNFGSKYLQFGITPNSCQNKMKRSRDLDRPSNYESKKGILETNSLEEYTIPFL